MAPSADERARALKIKREAFRLELAAFKDFLDGCDPQIQDIEIKGRLAELATEFAAFSKYQGDLDFTDETGDLMKERIALKNSYVSDTSRAQRLLLSVQQAPSRDGLERTTSNSPSASDAFEHDMSLPKLHLPQFSGCYEDWPGFSDQFRTAVHDNVKLNDCRKLLYLRSCLRGEASRLIESLENSSANYQPAWELLDERYNKPAVIVTNHVRALFNLPLLNRVNHQNLRQFLTDVESHYKALKTLNQPSADTLLVHLFLSRLDSEINLKWREHSRGNEFPTVEELCSFLRNRCHDIEPSGHAMSTRQSEQSLRQRNSQYQQSSRPFQHKGNLIPHKVHAVMNGSCPECNGPHAIYTCPKFAQASVSQRARIAASNKLCINCLRKGHSASACKMSGCRVCNEKHNTLLHTDALSNPQPSTSRVNITCLSNQMPSNVILSTAVIYVTDRKGNSHRCRVLLDSCAQSNFLTKSFAKELNLPRHKNRIPITGMNHMLSEVNYSTRANIQSRTTNFSTELTFLLTDQITEPLPDTSIPQDALELPRNIPLADPEFYKPAKVDGLIGAQLFWHLLSVGQIKVPNSTIMLRKTLLGWLVTGSNSNARGEKSVICNVALTSLDSQVAKFWELEETPQTKFLSNEEQACEAHYSKHTRRETGSGRYIVKLPFKTDCAGTLGESHTLAMKRFVALEKSFQRDPAKREQYVKFMREYEDLGHMTKADHPSRSEGYYLPHHAVRKEDSLTTKIRVVFDASAKTTSNLSLNDILMTGPTIQEDLFSIVTRFRTHRYVLTADIAKMYRQVKVASADRPFTKILWRENPNSPINTYYLNTVTYGTAPASYLAIKSLHQLADDEGEKYPLAARVLKSDFYVDDLLTGADTLQEAALIRDQLILLTRRGGFELRQWSSNDKSLLKSATVNNEEVHMQIVTDEFRKTLGVYWNQNLDTITYTAKVQEPLRRATKRAILSRIAQLFDPLGLLGPVIITAKIIMQKLWQLQLNWDESVPETLHTEWQTFESQLSAVKGLSIPRRIICNDHARLELHGFCDASEKAYGACVYLRSTSTSGSHASHLICSKSRVAPLKVQSLPRLELCAAVLLTKLFNVTIKSTRVQLTNVVFWTDSMITLHWIRSPPHTLKVFVANRVSKIHETTNKEQWRHVPSQENPADCLSRGVESVNTLRNNSWFRGPRYLLTPETEWPPNNLLPVDVPERRTVISLAATVPTSQLFIHNFSSITRLERVTAYCLRFYHKTIQKRNVSGSPSVDELRIARQRIIKLVQQTEFADEIKSLSCKSQPYNGRLRSLDPFLDQDGILRVGGRITNAEATYDRKHPMLLPAKHHLTIIIIRNEHCRQYHAGVRATLNSLRQTYWPINGVQAVKQFIRSCIPCHRANPPIPQYQMGNLPKNRVTANRPFLVTGVDYCGPLYIKEKRIRNTKTIKAYVAVFVCFSTRAVHIELVGDLTTSAFLAALRRFFARRGKSADIYSDNGKTFVGADRELREVHEAFKNAISDSNTGQYVANNHITWHFIPPRAPHFGGLWEASVKQVKRHLIRTVGKTLLTYEAMTTYLAEIEAILNSRPLIPLSSDPNDLTALTPGHFLTGDVITSTNEVSVNTVPASKLSMWQHVQQMREHFWNRWHKEYLHELIVRRKWHTQSPLEVQEGMLVILHEDNVPPLCGPLGRITAIHPGEDGVVRVATVKTIGGTYKRALKKLSPLPID